MGDKKPEPEEEGIDKRLDFIYQYLAKTMKLKSDKWLKMMATDEYRNILPQFFAKPDIKTCVIYLSAAGLLVPAFEFPPNPKNKITYFVRRKKEVITWANFREVLIFGDMSAKPMDELAVLLDEVFAPLLSNKSIQRPWPQIVCEDIQKHVHEFRNIVSQVKGAMANETILPMPAGAERAYLAEQAIRESEGENVDLKLKSAIEAEVVRWASLINDIINEESTIAFANGAHPTPISEVEFWEARLKNLESIYDQLRDPRIKKMASILELTNSAYLACFKSLFKNVVAGVTEARDIVLYIKPLVKHFDALEACDFLECKPLLKPMMHCLCLFWSNSRYFCSSARILTLMREVANLLIEQTLKQIDPGSLFQSEPEEMIIIIKNAISIFEYYYIDIFEDYREKLETFFSEERQPVPWAFHPRTAFQRIMDFVEKLNKVLNIFYVTAEYVKLEKVEVGGLKGRDISRRIQKVSEEFAILYAYFTNIQYDPLDTDDDSFEKDYEHFMAEVVELDRKLVAQFVQAYDECFNLESIFKLINVIGSLIDRPIIRDELCPKYSVILKMLNEELDNVKEIYDADVKEPPIDPYMPPVAGELLWLYKLRLRITKPMDDFKAVENEIVQSAEALYTIKKFDEMIEILKKKQAEIFEVWATSVPGQCEENLNKPLMIRGPDRLLSLNFDKKLEAILRETRYMQHMGIENLPPEAEGLFLRNEELIKCILNLKRTVEWYNHILTDTIAVEYELIREEVDHIDVLLDLVIDTLTWNSDMWLQINEIHLLVESLESRVFRAQDNITRMSMNMLAWGNTLLFERCDGKREALLSLDDRSDRVYLRYSLVITSAREIDYVLEENFRLYFNIPEEINDEEEEEEEGEWLEMEGEGEEEMVSVKSAKPETAPAEKEKKEAKGKEEKKEDKAKAEKGDKKKEKGGKDKKKGKKGKGAEEEPEEVEEVTDFEKLQEEKEAKMREREEKWIPYAEYVDNLVATNLIKAILTSMSLFMTEMDVKNKIFPLFEILVELKDPDIRFTPALNTEDPNGFFSLLTSLLNDILNIAELVPRVSKQSFLDNYISDVQKNFQYKEWRTTITNRVMSALMQVQQYAKIYDNYSYLWIDSREEFLVYFLDYGRQLTPEELLILSLPNSPGIPKTPPSLEAFKVQIDHYEELYKKLEELEKEHIFDGWLRTDLKPLRQAILNCVCKWGNMFKQHLKDHVVDSLNELQQFVDEAIREMQIPVAEGDYDNLIRVMGYLYRIKERTFATDGMFVPLKNTIALLKNYEVEFDEDVHTQLQELPDRWTTTKKIAATVKQLIAPLQAVEIVKIRKRIALFDSLQQIYRERFLKMDFFKFECTTPYVLLDKANHDIREMEDQTITMQESSTLFEIVLPEFDKLEICRKEIKQLKQIWDFIIIVRSSLDEWKTTPWKKIDVEAMEQECKKYAKEMRQFDKDIRTWETYLKIEGTVKNMVTSLRAVTELQNPAIRERHWEQLMQATKVKFVMDESTTLADLLALNLHKFEDEVKNIVDKSVKEMSMEKVLKELSAIWTTMEFEYEAHERTKARLLRVNEEMIEILEDHQNQLQNMMSSKFIGYFLTEVSDWQSKLSNVDQVLSIWFEVQRKWMYLESIFIGSEDIRNQLPEDSKRFDRIDREFRELLSNMSKEPNVVRACNVKGLADRLEGLQAQLLLCEKALNDYLETKRLAYPRFYFVSSADLLDILSNGNQPELVCKHLTKLYDSMAKLRFIREGDKNSKRAKGMVAKDHDEFVEFITPCDCSGKVEAWLNRLTEMMRKTLHRNFGLAVVSYEEKPRDEWLFDWPAQTALCGTQMWWTTETNIAFSKLEEGYENALKDYSKKQIAQLNALIVLLLSDLTKGDRQKIETVCTIDVHSRDVVTKLILAKVETGSAFQWQSQLRHRWDDTEEDCFANICDAQFRYSYEYLGNTPRLVVTPLTDRCYITLTQSLHLNMGGAPAGPAGTGKTETTKDLGRALGQMVYVFNCSEQMDYKSCGNIYKGLAQTGAWGCFDEFNRISVEVLSVVAVQVKSILDAVKDKKSRFNFMGEDIAMITSVGMFITMNPGYAGRTELPENLKALFRPCAMVVPDFELICEIMLVSQGFQEARLLARKFITLYTLCRELLSKQDHYDWGLRAIKSVLVVAGALKRDDRYRPEDQVLMRALRDFNIPKIVTDDVPIFMGLIGDLFPALDVPRKRDPEFEKIVRKSTLDLHLQPEDGFILKVVQLEELFAVRHSVFIVGISGTGKTMIWRTLNRTYTNQKLKPIYNDLNPKAVTNDELFGIINPATREWKDGLISVLMRDQANLTGTSPKWLVLDGDIDPMWIESLNTVMDDNKVLTLASNERIALTAQMRLLFEISNLRTATPATVSRAGILYINPQDLGWSPYVQSWVDTRDNHSEKATLLILFDKYIPSCLEVLRTKFKKITPIPEVAHLEMLCFLLNSFLTPANMPAECPKEWYEIYFVFACVWGFGSSLFQDQLVDWRNEFSKWWINEFKTVKFPSAGTVFSYYIDNETKKFQPWAKIVKGFELDPDIPLQATLVDTAETARLHFFMDILMKDRHPVMLVGGAGSGKSVIVSKKLSELIGEQYAVTDVPFNFYTTSEMLQKVLEKPLEKKAGRNYGPPGNKMMIYFIDDMNMPEVDTYGTVQPHTLLRQHIDYQHWYDRAKMTLKDIHNIQYVSCMNPTAGSFTIDPRLQRHFCVFAVSFPNQESVTRIYESILTEHLTQVANKFVPSIQKIPDKIVAAAITVHQKVSQTFLPTAVKFHYIFNLRDLSNIFQGMLFTTGEGVKDTNELVRLYMHEATRVYCDKFVEQADIITFHKLLNDLVKKSVEEIDDNKVFATPLIFSHFAEAIGDPKYMQVQDWNFLVKLLDEALSGYNDLVSTMNLVLFEDAINHICRINRILESPRGNALLIGVGGSGKQSLSRLSAFISSLEVFQIQLRKGYSINDLKLEFATLYMKAGLKNIGTVFLMTDAQVAEEKFLVVINDILATGEIPELFADDETENIINAMRNEVKAAGMVDSKENCWKYFIDRVRRQLKVVLCFSPVGSTLRVRARKFPAVVNCTSIDWFHEWPQEALESVSKRFLSELKALPPELVHSVSLFMSFVHTIVNQISTTYLLNEKRYNYTTPKSFLEQIALYSKLLTENTSELVGRIKRLENGLLKLADTAGKVDGLKEQLAVQEVILKEKNEAAEQLIDIVAAENEKVGKEQEIAAEEEMKVSIIEEDVTIKQKVCAEDLSKAEPALQAAQEALNTLNKNNLTEVKSLATPPNAVVTVCAAVLILFSKGKIPKDRSWKACKGLMGKVDQFLYDLVNYDKENIHPAIITALEPYIADPEFEPEKILSKSTAAAGLCAWVINIRKFYDVFVVVEPKRQALAKANSDLQAARNKLVELKEKLDYLQEQLDILKGQFEEATNAKLKCQAEADATTATIDLANRLVNGLGSEKVRWKESVANLKKSGETLPGDVLMITAFISYVGCFTRQYRLDLMDKYWVPFFEALEERIPITEGLDPLSLMTDEAQIAVWQNEGLPSDRMSTENATILSNSARWPLMIDPQLQGIKWIKTKYGDELVVIRLTMKGYLDKIEKALADGSTVLIENIDESVDAVLDPLLGRALIKKGRAIKIGDKEMDYNKNFRLILHTKLANPHYKPEMQAQTTLINFTVTRDGLEEQLLAEVVKAERPDLEELKAELTKTQNDFKITLKRCEDNLLMRLSSAGDDILSDVSLVENLETTKKTAAEIEIKVVEAKSTSIKIDEAREQYRPAAARASLLYFILNDLNRINAFYQFSLKAFTVVFNLAIVRAPAAEKLSDRVVNLIDGITFSVFMYTSRGLFERDKLIFMAQMTIQILLHGKEISPVELDFLLRFPANPNVTSPVDFLTNMMWGGIKTLADMDEFKNLDKDIEGAAKRWKSFVESECPEKEKFPQEWKNKNALQRLCMMRSIRPDRMTYATRAFVEEKLGSKYTESRSVEFAKSFEETNSTTPVFFILSPGVDPLKDVEKLGKKIGFTFDNRNFHNVSLGQGQEEVAEHAMEVASQEGHWVILQNIHLVAKWLSALEKKMEQCNENAHDKYRLYVSAEPEGDPLSCKIPQGILESAIKITNEPPTGMQANLHKSLDNFNQETLEMCSKEAEFKAILFSLCYFHAVVAERRKFGAQGWNRSYPFNVGDLTISVYVLYNYLENNPKVPWEDLRYLFGEIMYGGHITDDWDRRLCRTFLQEYMSPELVEGELSLAPNFLAPPNTDYAGYHKYIDDNLPPETPYLYGLHPNAEIGFLTTTSEILFRTIFEMQPRDSGATSAAGSREEKVKTAIEDIADKLPEEYNLPELMAKVEDKTPFVIVAFQECERMNMLVREMRTSLKELDLGLKGELTITSKMEQLEECLFMDNVPPNWTARAYPSLLPLGAWFADLCIRMKELESWASDFQLPSAVWLAGFFNPQSFLTAIMQQTARKNEWPLDKMCLNCDVTKKQREDFTSAPREGAYVYGLFMEGARWDTKIGGIVESRLKELFPTMPVIFIKAITQDKQDMRNMYDCPVYKTRMRGPTFVWTFNLKTKDKPARWTLAGVALILQI